MAANARSSRNEDLERCNGSVELAGKGRGESSTLGGLAEPRSLKASGVQLRSSCNQCGIVGFSRGRTMSDVCFTEIQVSKILLRAPC